MNKLLSILFSKHLKKLWHIIRIITLAAIVIFITKCEADFSIEQFYIEDSSEYKVYNEFKKYFGSDENSFFILIKSQDTFNVKTLKILEQLSLEIEKIDGVDEIKVLTESKKTSGNKSTLFVKKIFNPIPDSQEKINQLKKLIISDPLFKNVYFNEKANIALVNICIDEKMSAAGKRELMQKKIEEVIKKVKLPKKSYHLFGLPHIRNEITDLIYNNIYITIPLSILIIFLIAYLTFGRLGPALIPSMISSIAVLWVLGAISLFDKMNIFTGVSISIIRFTAFSFTVHIFYHFDKLLREVNDHKTAIYLTMKQMLPACFLVVITTSIGLFSLFTGKLKPVRLFGLWTGLGVISVFFLTIVIIPAIFLSRKDIKPSSSNFYKGFLQNISLKIAKLNMKKCKTIILASLLLFSFGIYGLFNLKVDFEMLENIKDSNNLKATSVLFNKDFGGSLAYYAMIDVEKNQLKEPWVLQNIEKFENYIKSFSHVGLTLSVVTFIKDLNKSIHVNDTNYFKIPESRKKIAEQIFLYEMSDDRPMDDFVNPNYSKAKILIRAKDLGSHENLKWVEKLNKYKDQNIDKRLKINVTGNTVIVDTSINYQIKYFIMSFIIAFVVIFVLIFILFKSIKLSVISILPNLFPLVLILGVMGFFDIKLRLSTSLAFAIAMGFAVDDTIMFLSTYKNEKLVNKTMGELIASCFNLSGKAIIATSVIMIFNFALMIFSELKGNITYGIVSILIVLFALIADLFLLPSLLIIYDKKGRVNNESK